MSWQDIAETLLLLVIVLLVAYINILHRSRCREVARFRKECLEKALQKPMDMHHHTMGITPLRYMEQQQVRYAKYTPSFNKMVFSTKPLETRCWYSVAERIALFGELPPETNKA